MSDTKMIHGSLDEIVEVIVECTDIDMRTVTGRKLRTALEKFLVVEEECERYKTALKNISNPIEFMKSNLKEGEELNGLMAIQMLKDSSFYQAIANKALATPKKGGEDE